MNERVSQAWRSAGEDLSILVEAPHRVALPDGSSVLVEAMVRDFGSPNGTIVTTTDDMPLWERLSQADVHCSAVNPLHYDRYVRARFVDALREWRWHGSGRPPEWYEDPAGE